MTPEERKNVAKRRTIGVLMLAAGIAVSIVVGNIVSAWFGLASPEESLVSKIGNFLVGATVICLVLVSLVKFILPNTVGVDYGERFNQFWKERFEPRDKVWAMLITTWVLLHCLTQLWRIS